MTEPFDYDAHATRILTDFEIGSCKKLYLLFLNSFFYPNDSPESNAYLERAGMLSAFMHEINTSIVNQLFNAAWLDAARKA